MRSLTNLFRRYDETVTPTEEKAVPATAESAAAAAVPADASRNPPIRTSPLTAAPPDATRLAFIDGHFVLREPAGILLIGWVADGSDEPVKGTLQLGTGPALASAWSFRYRRQDVATHFHAGAGAPDRHGFVAFFPFEAAPATSHGQVELAWGTTTFKLEVDLVGAPDRASQDALLRVWQLERDKLVAALQPFPGELLSALPAVGMPLELKFFVDHCLELKVGHFVSGWMAVLDGKEPQVYFVDETEHRAVNLSDRWVRTPRPDVVEALKGPGGLKTRNPGFLALAPIGAKPTHLFAFYLCTEHGCVRFPLAVHPVTDTRAALTTVLGTFKTSNSRLATAIEHVGPTLEAITAEAAEAEAPDVALRWFGTRPTKPAATVIVPLWRGTDLVRFQLGTFGAVRAAAEWELIFAVDDPELEESVLNQAEDWLELYRRPFAVASWDRNLGLLRALNLAATQARGEVLVFMHSDVLVDSTDWMERLLALLKQHPKCGIAGPKLLYEDGMVQSEGVGRRAAPKAAAFIEPELLRRGLPDRAPSEVPLPVDGITTACMAVRRGLFESLGGFDTGYLLQHSFGEFDLCLRAAQAGSQVLVDTTLTMRHLEGYSKGELAKSEPLLADAGWREKVQLGNAWRLTQRARAKGASS